MIFDHVQIKVESLSESRPFYAAVFEALGFGVVFDIEGVVVGFGTGVHDMVEIRQADEAAPLSKNVHVAFVASSEDQVRAFHAAAMAHGAIDNGVPGLRPEYEPGYYAAFVIDSNGHNLEAVYSQRNR